MTDPRNTLIRDLSKIRFKLSPEEAATLTEAIEALKALWDKLDHMPFYRGSHG